ncbi:MAG: ethanolamine ammonia-lyase subunit EutC [Acidobacteriaceae bacterium]
MAGIESRRNAASGAADDVWARLRRFTRARIGLGRVGGSLPTEALLDFELAHARARDAVHARLDASALAGELRRGGFGEAVIVASQARDRMEYLLRPDLGRALDEESRVKLGESHRGGCSLAVAIADGLSAVAPARHAVALLQELRMALGLNWRNVTSVVANHARVALGDEIGELLGAEAVVVLIGERPGLSSPDSLGVYLTWAPHVGRTDAERNCISNVRPDGLQYPEAAQRLAYLLHEARRLQLSGIALKDDSGERGARKVRARGAIAVHQIR